MIRDAILSITFIDGAKCPPQKGKGSSSSHPAFPCGTREIMVEDKDLIRSSGAPTESGSGRFPEQALVFSGLAKFLGPIGSGLCGLAKIASPSDRPCAGAGKQVALSAPLPLLCS